MKSTHDHASIVTLLTRLCDDIAVIETEYGLLAGNGDFRPRIEYFHDAVRAFASYNESSDDQADGSQRRLAVETLAYDVMTLRQLQDKPLMALSPHPHNLSPRSDVSVITPESLVAVPKRPDRKQREQLQEWYQKYAVFFAALLKTMADRDYAERTQELDAQVKEIDRLIHELEQFKKNRGNLSNLVTIAQHLEHDELRMLLTTFIQKASYKKKEDIDKLVAFLKLRSDQDDKDIRTIDNAHKDYAMAQLGLYEQSRDMLKKMAQSGVNLMGNFVENALRDSSQGRGR